MSKVISSYFVVIAIVICACNPSSDKMTPKKLGWKVGVQAWTFHKFTFFQTIDKVRQLGLHYIEAYPGQKIGGGLEGHMGYELDHSSRQKILNYLDTQGVKLIAIGVITPDTKAQWDSLFTFAHQMGIENITSEPPKNKLVYLSHLCKSYHINVAIHNHAAPSPYWNPDTLLDAIQGKSRCIGAAADVGHWAKSGLSAVESLKELKGHIIELHMKDIKSKKSHGENAVWGKGLVNMQGVAKELYRQKFKGLLSIEYPRDPNPKSKMSDIKKSLELFDKVIVKKLK